MSSGLEDAKVTGSTPKKKMVHNQKMDVRYDERTEGTDVTTCPNLREPLTNVQLRNGKHVNEQSEQSCNEAHLKDDLTTINTRDRRFEELIQSINNGSKRSGL